MSQEEITTAVHDWGIEVKINQGVRIDNTNLLHHVRGVVDACRKAGKTKALIDSSSTPRTVSVTELFEALSLLNDLKTTGFRFAFVSPHLVDKDESNFVENYAHNRAILIRYFSSRSDALSWLLR